ncbi:fimbrial protein [Lelliottia sp. V89_10]|uniref:fimbrial protein n=1 Tax=Lelliottia wanjuensis TaxID=3050585 RepID=UPI00249F68F8|nr:MULTISPECIES: fimbrial protein [unclassified Lelliottia]MDI3361041.1 fimbrial protein [Lelliottia sp. V89_13]MDK9549647.1 fimbrial protein [Lelliottia sp. V89_5]MDK9595646.1 fimbrial protein [Lelliottia sp. V89_10]
MKKFNRNMALASLVTLILAPGMANAATDSSLSLDISGALVSSEKCTVNIKPSLDLGEVIDTDIKTSDQAPQAMTGATTLSFENCASAESVLSVSLQGSADATDTSLLTNTSQSGAASNVGVGVWTFPDFKQLTVGGEASTFAKPAGVSNLGINLIVALAKTDGAKTIEPGLVTSSAQFKIDYL